MIGVALKKSLRWVVWAVRRPGKWPGQLQLSPPEQSRGHTGLCEALLCACSGSERMMTVEVSGEAELRVWEKLQTLQCSQWEMEGLAGIWRP